MHVCCRKELQVTQNLALSYKSYSKQIKILIKISHFNVTNPSAAIMNVKETDKPT